MSKAGKILTVLLLMLTLMVCQTPLVAIADDAPADIQASDEQTDAEAASPEPEMMQPAADNEECTLTLHWSSIDGVDLVAPIKITVQPGTKIKDALEQYKTGMTLYTVLFEKEGYCDSRWRTNKPFTEYTDYTVIRGQQVPEDGDINTDTDLYYLMFKEIDEMELSVEAPKCGTETTVVYNAWEDQTNPPVVSIPKGANYIFNDEEESLPAIWAINYDDEPYKGSFVAGKEYLADTWLDAKFGYRFTDAPDITINGGTLDDSEFWHDQRRLILYANVTAEHDPADPVKESVVEPGCTKAGSHVEVVNCKACSAEISRTEVTDPALGHDWGEWKKTKEPTETEKGEEERVCKRCGEKETRAVAELVVEYSNIGGDADVWTKGSSKSLIFKFERSVNHEAAFSHFTGIKVDGVEVSEDSYTAKAGSVVIELLPGYLETLDEGKHILTAVFDDGNKEADADFYVTLENEDEEAASDSDDSDKKKGSPDTGDQREGLIWLMILCSAGLALSDMMIRRKRER